MNNVKPLFVRFGPSLCLFLSGTVLAFQPLVTDDTGTQGAGGNQLELAMARENTDTDKSGAGAAVYTRGLTDTLDVFVELGHQGVNTPGVSKESGPTNPAIGLKWRFYENERKTSLAIKPIYVAPLSAENENKGLGSGKSSHAVSLIFTQELGWGAVHANLNTRRENFRDQANGPDEKTNSFSVAPVWNVAEEWKLAVDLGERRSEAGGTNTRSRFGELGVIFSPNASLDFALGYIEERDRDRAVQDDAKIVTGGVTWRFK